LVNYFEFLKYRILNNIHFVEGANAKLPGKMSPTTVMGSGQGIAGPGRTMKECEDQLSVLKKENFNLKLRIYFLEERMGVTSADEDAIKKNIELKVCFLYNILIYLYVK
jgi:centrosomin